MKNRTQYLSGLLIAALGCASTHAVTTIDSTDRYAYGANIGWIDCGNTTYGAVIGEYVCSGYLYSANCGWINLGDGTPANQIQYQNNSATDFGVNTDADGNLRGYAYGANIGWIAFESTGAPKVDLFTGDLSGYAWSANCGWICLDSATAHVATDSIAAGADSDGDGLADAWEQLWWSSLRHAGGEDADGDGMDNEGEYLAGTDPTDSGSLLVITSFGNGTGGDPSRFDMTWQAVATRQYAIQYCNSLTNAWSDFTVFPFLGANNAAWNDYHTNRFYRIRAFRPLTP